MSFGKMVTKIPDDAPQNVHVRFASSKLRKKKVWVPTALLTISISVKCSTLTSPRFQGFSLTPSVPELFTSILSLSFFMPKVSGVKRPARISNYTHFCFGLRLEGLRRGCLFRDVYHRADIDCSYSTSTSSRWPQLTLTAHSRTPLW